MMLIYWTKIYNTIKKETKIYYMLVKVKINLSPCLTKHHAM